MAVVLEIEHLDEYRERLGDSRTIIINDLPNKSEEDRIRCNELIMSTFTTDTVTLEPKCDCEALHGEYLAQAGVICDKCGTPVQNDITSDIIPLLWFRAPDGVEKLMNPMIFMMLNERLKKGEFSMLRWLTDRSYVAPKKEPACLLQVKADGIERGYNFFVRNFDELIDYLFKIPDFRPKKNLVKYFFDMLGVEDENGDVLRDLIRINREKIFTSYMPIPNRTLTILESTSSGRYVDFSIMDGKDAINMMISIDRDYYDQNATTKENRTARALAKLADYHLSVFKKHMTPKEGHFRQNIYAGRTNLSFRAVITSHEDLIRHDHILMPWCCAVTTLRIFLMSKLMDHSRPDCGFTDNEAVEFIMSHVYRYHPLLDKLFKEIINDYADLGGIPCLQLRNPTLLPGSSQVMFIEGVKPDPMDTSVSVHDHAQVAYNGDYDGDEEMHTIIPDRQMLDMLYSFRSFFTLHELNRPFEIAKPGSLRDTDVATISNWMAQAA